MGRNTTKVRNRRQTNTYAYKHQTVKKPFPPLRSDRKRRHLPRGVEKRRRYKQVDSPNHRIQPLLCSMMSIDTMSIDRYKPRPS